MKKALILISAAVMVVSISVTSAFAANNGSGQNFVDADRDGICDNRDMYQQSGTPQNVGGKNFVDADNNGICDNAGKKAGCCYTDTDNDGICDTYAANKGARQGNGFRGGRNK